MLRGVPRVPGLRERDQTHNYFRKLRSLETKPETKPDQTSSLLLGKYVNSWLPTCCTAPCPPL